jgi:hypothetical protein
MKRRKRTWKAVLLALFFGGMGYFYFGLWIGLAGTLAWFGALSLMNWIVSVSSQPANLIGFGFLLTNALFILPALRLCKRHNQGIPANQPEPPQKAIPSLRKSLKIAVALFVVDAFFLNQGIFSAVFLAVLLLGVLPVALYSALRKRWPEFRLRMATIGIYAIACLAVFGANYLNNAMAQRRAIQLGQACRQFQVKYNRYPRFLGELEPEFISSVPLAKYAFMDSDFFYLASSTDPRVWFVELPPFGRRFYHVKTGNWGYMD